MITPDKLTARKAINKAYLKVKPNRNQIENFKTNLIELLDGIKENESEEFHKNLASRFLLNTYYADRSFINTKERTDLVIYNGKDAQSSAGVIIEAKNPLNKYEMLTVGDFNRKAMHELVLYFLRERITRNNKEIKQLIATNIYEWFIFDATVFENLFAKNEQLVNDFKEFEAKRLTGTNTDYFYKDIAAPFIAQLRQTVSFTYIDLRQYEKPLRDRQKENDSKLIPLYKLFSPEHLLKLPFVNDSNSLDRGFYNELLQIIGLEETKEGSKKIIGRKVDGKRDAGSLLENTITVLQYDDCLSNVKRANYGSDKEEQLFNLALELVITWVNRILFLKLLEGQLISYHKGDKSYRFLNSQLIGDFDELNKLFFRVLALREDERSDEISKKYGHVPYLNSSLFEPSELEHKTIRISNLEDGTALPVLGSTILKNQHGKRIKGELNALHYLFRFLDAYDFASEGAEEIQEENKTLINASVLGLIFEKINGYKDGSFFTPGFITMYMCRETIRRAVVQKFNETWDWNCAGFDELKEDLVNEIRQSPKGRELVRREANDLVNSLRICDPAVGSGHFLVSALNELIAVKSELNILTDRDGKPLNDYSIEIVNDELIVADLDGIFFEYHSANKESQRMQETLFHEKQTLIENCLFGVDINPNSVKICRLRLWIELLKNAYYRKDGKLETLPNIDINIKCGNSLISRYALDADIKKALKRSKWTIDSYRLAVQTYREASSKEEKREMERLIATIKSDFESEIESNDKRVVKLNKLKGELYLHSNQQGLFELTKTQQKVFNKKSAKLAADINKLETELEEIRSNKIYENAFEWRFEFPEVLNNDGDFVGFDVVIGNPPYGVKAVNQEKDYFKKNFKSIVGKFDSYGFFIEKGLKILQQNGQFGYIIPHTWLTVLEAQSLRDFLLEETVIKEVNLLPSRVFEDATVETTNLFLQKRKSNSNSEIKIVTYPTNTKVSKGDEYLKIFFVPIQVWISNRIFNLKISKNENLIIGKMKEDSVMLQDITELSVGIQAYDSYAGQSNDTIKNKVYHSNVQKDETFVKELNGKDILRYSYNWPGDAWVSYGKWLAHPRQKKFFNTERILIREITSNGKYKIVACLIEEYLVNYKSVLNIISKNNEISIDLATILGIINSSLFSWYFEITSNKIVTNTFPRISIYDLKTFPIKLANQICHEQIKAIVIKIQTIKSQDPSADTSALEAEIDLLVYKLYGLTWEEVRIVDPEFGMSEEAYEQFTIAEESKTNN